jgi:hypothetical protein
MKGETVIEQEYINKTYSIMIVLLRKHISDNIGKSISKSKVPRKTLEKGNNIEILQWRRCGTKHTRRSENI